MQVRYFYEIDCYNLNRHARLYYPLTHRMVDYFHRLFAINLNDTLDSAQKSNTITGKIVNKINCVSPEKINWDQNLMDASYVVFDTETTGLQPFRGDRIISLGGVVVENGEIRKDKTYEQLINPQRPIPTTASEITGITTPMVSDKPTLFEVLPDFLDFVGNRILIAHSATFDIAFLNIGLCQLAPIRILNPVIDTYLLSYSILPDMIEYSLESLAKRYEINIKDRHTVLGDSFMTAEVFLNLLKQLTEKGIFTLNQLAKYLIDKRNMYYTLSLPEQR
ncbi:MAG: exonuclease domain-containing protein [Bacillota bacterium]|nr:exonuclease domain-containing protein [Bacillota bacterium]